MFSLNHRNDEEKIFTMKVRSIFSNVLLLFQVRICIFLRIIFLFGAAFKIPRKILRECLCIFKDRVLELSLSTSM